MTKTGMKNDGGEGPGLVWIGVGRNPVKPTLTPHDRGGTRGVTFMIHNVTDLWDGVDVMMIVVVIVVTVGVVLLFKLIVVIVG